MTDNPTPAEALGQLLTTLTDTTNQLNQVIESMLEQHWRVVGLSRQIALQKAAVDNTRASLIALSLLAAQAEVFAQALDCARMSVIESHYSLQAVKDTTGPTS